MENKYTSEDLKIMQSWDLERKIRVTQTRIIEWYERLKGQCYVSFSGGKDSTVLLDLARRIYPDIEAVFVDTGLEYPEIKEFVKSKENITILRPEKGFKQVIVDEGYPIISKAVSHNVAIARRKPEGNVAKNIMYNPNRTGMFNHYRWNFLIDAPFLVSDRCCDIMKKKPAKKYSKDTGKLPILGTMANESKLRYANWIKNGCNSFSGATPTSQPMSFWTEQDVVQYLKQFNIPYCSVYGDIVENDKGMLETTGCNRTGCVFCGFGCHLEKEPNRFQRLKETHPKLHEYCMKPVEKGGLGMKEVLDYIGVPYE